MQERYIVVRRFFNDHPSRVVARDLTLEEAQKHCDDPETSSRTCKKPANVQRTKKFGPWFDGYEKQTRSFS